MGTAHCLGRANLMDNTNIDEIPGHFLNLAESIRQLNQRKRDAREFFNAGGNTDRAAELVEQSIILSKLEKVLETCPEALELFLNISLSSGEGYSE